MKRTRSLSLLLLFPVYLMAQSFSGYLTDNYNGVHGLIINPANIADSPRALDINFITFSAFAENDYYAISFGELFSGDSDFDSNTMISASENNNFLVNLDIMGPSFMFNFSKKHSLAIFSRARVLANINEVNGLLLENFIDDFDENDDFIADEGNFNLNVNAWAELGATLGFTLYDDNEHFFKGGVSVKYLQGLGNVSGTGTDIFFEYDADGTALPNNETTGSINSRGTFTYSNTDNLEGDVENLELLDDANGLGFDIGFVYEWRPEKQDKKKDFNEKVKKKRLYQRRKKYKLKLGISLTDVGSINYKNINGNSYNLDAQNINEEDLTNADDFEEALGAIYTFENFDENQKVQLPTSLRLEVDYKITKGLYLNANANISMVDAVTANTSSLPSS